VRCIIFRERADLAEYHRAQFVIILFLFSLCFFVYCSNSRIDQRKSQSFDEKQRDYDEGAQYRRLAEQDSFERTQMQLLRKTNQNEVKHMYDQTIVDKHRIKQIEQQIDDV
jgi:septal ring factor EnvC (AmiA/AmiB activator)